MSREDEYRALLEELAQIHAKNEWNPKTVFPTEASRNWHDGYISLAAHVSIRVREVLDPAGSAAVDEHMRLAAEGSDTDWWKATGHCGRCSLIASACECMGQCECWTAHGAPLEPYTPPAALRTRLAAALRELEAYRVQPLPFAVGGEAS